MTSFPRFPGLDGLRGIAVLALCGHAAEIPGFASGDRGNEVFFVLTGFLVTASLLHQRDATKSIEVGRFYLRRAARILPALGLLLVALMALTLSGHATWPRSDFLRSLPYAATCTVAIQAMSGAIAPPFRHLDVLSWGVICYLAVPLVLRATAESSARMRLLSRACLVLFGLCVTARLVLAALASNDSWPLVDLLASSHIDGFGLGLLCAVALRRGVYIPRRAVMLALPILLVCFVVPHSPWCAAAGSSAAIVATAVLILGSAGARASRFMHALDVLPIRWIGSVAFALYLWHPPLVLAFRSVNLPEPVRWAAALAASLAVATLSGLLVERPILRRFAGPPRA